MSMPMVPAFGKVSSYFQIDNSGIRPDEIWGAMQPLPRRENGSRSFRIGFAGEIGRSRYPAKRYILMIWLQTASASCG